MDLLADVLTVTRMGSTTLAHAELVPPWGLYVDPIAEAHVHVVLRGSCWLRAAGQQLQLLEGDVVLIRSGVAHSLSNPAHAPLAPYRDVLASMPGRLAALREPAETTVVLCAKYLSQQLGPHPLLALFPPLVHLTAREVARHEPLSLALQLLKVEARDGGGGSEHVVPRLVDSLLVFVVRVWLEGQPLEGWFAALREPAIARALACMHERPAHAWTVQSLAKEAGQSRATFARRFVELIGETPAAYLARWRMCVASKLLSESALSLEQIATRVGYETAAAFSRAFSRSQGVAPGRFRASRV
jgi:AraC-like DNA-binding protein